MFPRMSPHSPVKAAETEPGALEAVSLGGGAGGMDKQVIANMRARVEQCRRLARGIGDPQTVEILTKMAEDIEADIARLSRSSGDGPASGA